MGFLSFGTVDSRLLYDPTGGVGRGVHVTNPPCIRTMFISTFLWSTNKSQRATGVQHR